MTENPIVISDDDSGDTTDPSNHSLHQMTVDNPGVGGEKKNRDASGTANISEVVVNSGKRSRSLSGSDRTNGRGSGWAFNVFAEGDSSTEGDGSPSSKRVQSSSHPSEAAKNGSFQIPNPLASRLASIYLQWASWRR